MDLEPAEDQGMGKARPLTKGERAFIHDAQLPNGRTIPLLKTVLTSACERNCFYCPFRAGRDFRRASFKPDEFAGTFMDLLRAGAVQGLFLSSGMAGGGIRTQDQLLDSAEILRRRYGFKGYLHLKIMPGAEKAQVEHAMRLADRVSVNLEAPNPQRLALLAPAKVYWQELAQPLAWIDEIRRSQPAHLGWNGRWPSITTQFVVGAVGESDLELLQTTQDLTRTIRLARAYFSAFRPIPGTPFENLPGTSTLRHHRLYQASFLLRDYGFSLDELLDEHVQNLELERDPKAHWASLHLVEQLVEINRADLPLLLRVPGIGPTGARRILQARRTGRLHTLSDLGRLGINPERAAPYILLDGRRPDQQLRLFVV
jgi:predicted DNA-binding helix-hairpin-helix protein